MILLILLNNMKILTSIIYAIISCILLFLLYTGLLGIFLIDISIKDIFQGFISFLTEGRFISIIIFIIFTILYFLWDKEKYKKKFIKYWFFLDIVLISLGLIIENNYFNNLG